MEINEMVKLPDGRIGMVENIDDEGISVRVYVQNQDEYIPTDDVALYAESDLKPLFDSMLEDLDEALDAFEDESEDGEELEEEPKQETETDIEEMKAGDFVEWDSEAGLAKGRIVKADDEGIEIEVIEDGKATGAIVKLDAEMLSKIDDMEVEELPEEKARIMCKFKSFKAEEDEEIGYIEGLVSPYGNVDFGGDVVEKGAYNQFLNASGKTPLQLDHGYYTSDVAGVAMYEDSEGGLVLKGKMNLKVPKVKDCFEMIKFMQKEGIPMGLSIGYETIKSDYDASGIRRLKELMLHESSITPFPMNTMARINSAKSRKLEREAKRLKWQNAYKRVKSRKEIEQPDGIQSVRDELKNLLASFK